MRLLQLDVYMIIGETHFPNTWTDCAGAMVNFEVAFALQSVDRYHRRRSWRMLRVIFQVPTKPRWFCLVDLRLSVWTCPSSESSNEITTKVSETNGSNFCIRIHNSIFNKKLKYNISYLHYKYETLAGITALPSKRPSFRIWDFLPHYHSAVLDFWSTSAKNT